MKRRIAVKKYMGDDAYSWAVFVDGRPVVSGLSRSEARYHRGQVESMLAARDGVAR